MQFGMPSRKSGRSRRSLPVDIMSILNHYIDNTKEDSEMSITKTAATWIWSKIKAELTIQKPTIEQMRPEERHENRILKNGMNGFAMIILICAVCAVFVL